MKHPVRLVGIVLALVIGLAVFSVSVKTQDGARGPLRLAVSSARDLRDWDSRLTRMERDGELVLRKSEQDTMLPGRRHEHLVQTYHGVPIFGADVTRQSERGIALSVYGTLYGDLGLDVAPTIAPEVAAGTFEEQTGVELSPASAPRLMVLPRDDGTFVLAYRVSQFTGSELPVIFVNARSGVLEWRYNNLQASSAVGHGKGVLGDDKKVSASPLSGGYSASDTLRPPSLVTFDLGGNLARVKQILQNRGVLYTSDIAFDSDNEWNDPVVVDAHAYLGWTYDYWYKRFGRRGMDDQNGGIYAIVHPISRSDEFRMSLDDWGTFAVNAFWCGGCGQYGRGIMVFGEGLPTGYYTTSGGQYWNYLAGGLDVIAHELTHGLTQASSGLIYNGESGALNEAFSDVLGTGAEFYYQTAGTGSLRADYLIGEDVVTASAPGSKTGIRSLADPAAFGDPDHYSKRYKGTSDNGGVHSNSLIAGHAYYLAIEGGTNRTSGQTVQGVGSANREQIEKIFYRAFAYFLTSNSTFATARAATIRAAQELYGVGSTAERAITQAWSAVGVN
jgi:Zn-dependent metalloprotease